MIFELAYPGLRALGWILLGVLVSGSAHAGGPAFTRLFAVADDAETSVMSPAGMTRLDQSQLVTQLIYAQSFAEFEVDENRTTTGGGNPRDADPAVIPSLYYVRPFGEDWRLGLSLNVPSGFGAGNGPNWAGRYYSDQFDLVFVSANVTVAYPVTDKLSLGWGFSVIYSSSDSTTQVNNPGPTDGDAKLEMEAEGAAVGYMASALYEWSDRTRFAINWHSETEPDEDVEVDLKRSTLPPAIVDAINREGDNIDAKIRTPQMVQLGAYHEFDNGWSASLDAMWVEFSRFGLTEVSVDGQDLHAAEGAFNDFWVVTAGFAFPLTQRMEGRIGALYMEQPVDDEDRTFSFALDEVYGVGAGIHYTRGNGHSYDLNLSIFDTGDAPVDTGPASVLSPRGRVAGENDDPYAITLEFTYYWN
jgi:long-chain fatty acid transport protein